MIIYLASFAAGAGDLAFAARMCEHLESRRFSTQDCWALCLSVQSGRIVDNALSDLRSFITQPEVAASVLARCLSVFDRNAGKLSVPPGDGERRVQPCSLIIQGPLLVFNSAQEAAGALGLQLAPDARLLTIREFGQSRFCCTRPPWSLPGTVPGQLNVSQVQVRPALPAHIDVSAGLDDDEVGIWNLGQHRRRTVAAATAPPTPSVARGDPCGSSAPPHRPEPDDLPHVDIVTGYFRTGAHGVQLGRMLGCVAAWRTAHSRTSGAGHLGTDGPRAPRVHTVVAVVPGQHSLPQVVQGLSSHPMMLTVTAALHQGPPVLSIVEQSPKLPDTQPAARLSSSGPGRPALGEDQQVWDELARMGCHVLKARGPLAVVGRYVVTLKPGRPAAQGEVLTGSGLPHVAPAHAAQTTHSTVSIVFLSLEQLQLGPSDFQSVLACSSAAVVCGDGSLNEALCCPGLPMWYSADGHKIFTGQALDGIATSHGGGASNTGAPSVGAGAAPDLSVIAAWWRFLRTGTGQDWAQLQDRLGSARSHGSDERQGASNCALSLVLCEAFDGLRARVLCRPGCACASAGHGRGHVATVETEANATAAGRQGALLPPPCGDLGCWLDRALPVLLPPCAGCARAMDAHRPHLLLAVLRQHAMS